MIRRGYVAVLLALVLMACGPGDLLRGLVRQVAPNFRPPEDVQVEALESFEPFSPELLLEANTESRTEVIVRTFDAEGTLRHEGTFEIQTRVDAQDNRAIVVRSRGRAQLDPQAPSEGTGSGSYLELIRVGDRLAVRTQENGPWRVRPYDPETWDQAWGSSLLALDLLLPLMPTEGLPQGTEEVNGFSTERLQVRPHFGLVGQAVLQAALRGIGLKEIDVEGTVWVERESRRLVKAEYTARFAGDKGRIVLEVRLERRRGPVQILFPQP